MNHRQFLSVFPLGSHLCREPMPPMPELKRDMELLKRAGFNLVKLQEHWAIDEPLEGAYDFGRYHELIEHAARLDMGVYLGLTCEQAPGWLYRKHPSCRMVGKNGLPVAYEAQTTLPADGKPGPCYDHPGAAADQARFIKELVRQLGVHENIVVWNTWQEVGYWAGLAGADVCYCEHTLAAFRDWLHARYGDLDGLNRAWNTRYLDWQYVMPSREQTMACVAQNVSWNYFMTNVQMTRVLERRAQAIREADPLQRPVFAHKGAPGIGSGADWHYARAQDFLGSSTYPSWGPFRGWDDASPGRGQRATKHETLLEEMYSGMAIKFDYVRSSNRTGAPIWAAEFQGGPVSSGFVIGRVPTPADIRRWMLTGVASGVTGISFWVTRAEIMAAEANGFSLLDSTGESTPRFEEVARVGRALSRYPQLFARPSCPPSPAGILISETNYQVMELIAHARGHLEYSVRGWHRLLWEMGIAADFVSVEHVAEQPLKRYDVLILPMPLSLSEEVAEHLAAYVAQGGHLISEACPGRINEHAFCPRGEISPTMAKLFGVAHESLRMVREPGDERRWSPLEMGWGQYLDAAMLVGTGELAGRCLRANVHVETFTCTDSQPIAVHEGAIVGTARQHGAGQAYLLGTVVGHNGTAYKDPETREFIRALLTSCGVEPDHAGQLLLRRRVAGKQEAWVITNPTPDTATESLEVPPQSSVTDLLGEEFLREDDQVTLTVPSLEVRVLIIDKQ